MFLCIFTCILHFVLCPHCYSKLSDNFCTQLYSVSASVQASHS